MLSVPPPTRVALGTLEIGGQKVELFLSPEWARYFISLNTQVVESALGSAANGALAMLNDDMPEAVCIAPGYDFSNGAYPGNFTALEVVSVAAEHAIKWSKAGANKWTLGSYVGGAYLANYSTGAKHMQFTDAGLTQIFGGVLPAIYVDGLQRVGIGVPIPGYALDVAGRANATTGYSVGGTAGITGTATGVGGMSITYVGGLVVAASSGGSGISGTMTTESLVGKTLTFTDGIITGFA